MRTGAYGMTTARVPETFGLLKNAGLIPAQWRAMEK
jgi:hypothetical protein